MRTGPCVMPVTVPASVCMLKSMVPSVSAEESTTRVPTVTGNEFALLSMLPWTAPVCAYTAEDEVKEFTVKQTPSAEVGDTDAQVTPESPDNVIVALGAKNTGGLPEGTTNP